MKWTNVDTKVVTSKQVAQALLDSYALGTDIGGLKHLARVDMWMRLDPHARKWVGLLFTMATSPRDVFIAVAMELLQ